MAKTKFAVTSTRMPASACGLKPGSSFFALRSRACTSGTLVFLYANKHLNEIHPYEMRI